MTGLILIRHGETDWNTAERWQGQADVPLNARGEAQARALAGELSEAGLTMLYASDLQRARRTAEILAEESHLPIRIDARLREIHQGEWEGLHISEIRTRYAEHYQRRVIDPWTLSPPGGETGIQVRQRVLPAVQEIAARHPHETVGVVTHGFVIAVLLAYYRDAPSGLLLDLVPGHCQPVKVVVN